MSGKVKYIKLKRSENYGFGFSILGGAGSELPPLIYDVIEGSPAAKSNQLSPGDIILEINGQDVLTFTTKEVLNCLRLSAREVILKLKTDNSLKEKVNHLRKTPNNSEILRTAITQDDLQGVKQILAKKSEHSTSENALAVESPTSSSSFSKIDSPNGSNSSFEEDGFRRGDAENDWYQQKKPKKKSDESSGASAANKPSGQRGPPCATSPPLSEDESDIESLHSFHYSPKAVDIPSAVRLAKRLFALDGFKKSDVSRHLSKNNEFSRAVAEEYLRYFDLRRDTLDIALRKFLDKFCLSGETQERERVLVHFSKRFLDCNPGNFNSQDAVHTLTCALMLLNTDLHSQNIGRKMTSDEFIDNLAELNDGENFNPAILKSLYEAIRAEPLKWATDEDEDDGKGPKGILEEGHRVIGSNPFLTTPIGSGVVYKKGYIMRKCCVEPSGKRTAFGKRSWKMWFCVIQDLILYLHKDEQGARRGPPLQMGHNAVRLHHALAQKAFDYSKKEHVFRLQTADQAEYLLQTSDSKELQAWIDAINFVAASLSAPPMPGAVGSQRKFQRPLLPCSITKLNVMEQLEDHTLRLNRLESDLNHLKTNPPDKAAKSPTVSSYKEKEIYLTAEVKRYQTYVYLLRSRLEAAGGSAVIGGAVCGLGINELPVFEVNTEGVQVKEVGPEEVGDPAVIVPPPIPERPRHSDSEDEPDDTTDGEPKAEEKGIQTNEKKDKFTDKFKHKKDDEFKKELDKMIKEKEKRDKKREKQEKKEHELTLKREKRNQEKKETTSKTNEKENENIKVTPKGNEESVKENKNSNGGLLTKEPLHKSADTEEDHRVGTFNRLSAIFKFSKLNRSRRNSFSDDEQQVELLKKDETYKRKEIEVERETDIISFPLDDEGKEIDLSISFTPPPLPPKPGVHSPIRKNLGTRVINA